MITKNDKNLLWAFLNAYAFLMIMYYLVFGDEMINLLYIGSSIIFLELLFLYMKYKDEIF